MTRAEEPGADDDDARACCSPTRFGLAAVTAEPTSCSKAMDNAAAARARSTRTNSPRTYHICVLDRCAGLLTRRKKDSGTDNDADQSHQQAPEGRPTRPIASQPGMCSLDGRRVIERQDDQRLRWSKPMESPPPESNRRPHPYHGTTRNRCAERRSPRSRPTVTVEVIGSPSTRLCVLLVDREVTEDSHSNRSSRALRTACRRPVTPSAGLGSAGRLVAVLVVAATGRE
jgi:hypothetical protein